MSPAVKMAEIQQVELPVVLRVVDGVNVLEQKVRGGRKEKDWSERKTVKEKYGGAVTLMRSSSFYCTIRGGMLNSNENTTDKIGCVKPVQSPHPLHFLFAANSIIVA